ncbi:hypothetical protein OK015_10915 [Mycobacterium sp. Aquia_216]|uniref:hypothetical protein n=1 Tax=Mycobacterium sp. Aquia_216 TaxID=2991729 RepID=UPI00227C63D4|nr:hypothetical protein [Mycobacterium sp. Aquia_216]WAJ46907.1 hypothetical protein OK015_10915 [Mycobacterium sp. Aquia_216]
MDVRGAHQSRRWQPAIAAVAALTLFISLVAGSALRSQFSAATLPEPAAWSQVTPDVGSTAGHSQARHGSPAAIHLQHASSWDASPISKKPFHSMWMTHDRPDVWTRMQSHPLWSALPASFAGMGFQSGDVRPGAPAAECGDQEILTLLCVTRR